MAGKMGRPAASEDVHRSGRSLLLLRSNVDACDALIAMPLQVLRPTALSDRAKALPQLDDQLVHPIVIGFEGLVGGVDLGRENVHVGKGVVPLFREDMPRIIAYG